MNAPKYPPTLVFLAKIAAVVIAVIGAAVSCVAGLL